MPKVVIDGFEYVPAVAVRKPSESFTITEAHIVEAMVRDNWNALLWALETEATPSEMAGWSRAVDGEPSVMPLIIEALQYRRECTRSASHQSDLLKIINRLKQQ